MTTTLRDVIPQPAKPPKRNFLRENVQKLKTSAKEKPSIVENVPPIVRGSFPLQPVQAVRRSSAKNLVASRQSNASGTSNPSSISGVGKRVASEPKPVVNSTKPTSKDLVGKTRSNTSLTGVTQKLKQEKKLTDTSCQTVDVTSDMFLKDCIIRYPSEEVEKAIQKAHLQAVSNGNKLFQGKDEHSTRLNGHITRLSEFLDTGAVSKPNKTQMILAKSRKITEKRLNKKNAFKRVSPKPQAKVTKETFHSAQELELGQDSNRTTKSDVKSFSSDSMKSPWTGRTELHNEVVADGVKNGNNLAGGDRDSNDRESNHSQKEENDTETSQDSQGKRGVGNKFQLPNSYRMGEVPKYLREIKEQKRKEEELNESVDKECPTGHVPLSDRDRKEALSIAKKKFRDLVNELNKLPMSTQTLANRRRKSEIEKELNKLEESIKIFSRPKVYVKMDQS